MEKRCCVIVRSVTKPESVARMVERKYSVSNPGCDFFFWAQFSRKLARLYEYSYLGPVLYMNIHIAHDTKVFVTLREKKKKKKKPMKYPFPVPSPNPNPNYNTKSKPLHYKQLQKTMHTILPNVYRTYLV